MGKDLVLIGYVRTGYNERSLDEIKSDVESYASWKGIEVEGGTAMVDGIFFDETSDSNQERLQSCKGFAQTAFENKCVKVRYVLRTRVSEMLTGGTSYRSSRIRELM